MYHNSFIKLHFTKLTNWKHVTFNNWVESHQNSYASIRNNLWLALITFFKWSPMVWKSHQCAHNMLNNYLPCTYHESPCQMRIWWNYSRNIMHPNCHLIWNLQVCTFNMFETSKLLNLTSPYVKWNSWFQIHHEQ